MSVSHFRLRSNWLQGFVVTLDKSEPQDVSTSRSVEAGGTAENRRSKAGLSTDI